MLDSTNGGADSRNVPLEEQASDCVLVISEDPGTHRLVRIVLEAEQIHVIASRVNQSAVELVRSVKPSLVRLRNPRALHVVRVQRLCQ